MHMVGNMEDSPIVVSNYSNIQFSVRNIKHAYTLNGSRRTNDTFFGLSELYNDVGERPGRVW